MKKMIVFLFAISLFPGCSNFLGNETKEKELSRTEVRRSISQVVHISSKDSFKNYLPGKNVVAKFHAAWCPPCKLMAPRDKNMAEEFSGKVTFLEMDIDLNKNWIASFGVRGVPTYILLKDGKEVSRWVGARSEADYRRLIKGAFDL